MNAILLPILIPLALIIVLLFTKSQRAGAILGIVGSLLLLGTSVYLFAEVRNQELLVLQVGGWKAPFGISLVIDYLAAIMLLVSAFIFLAISIYAHGFVREANYGPRFYIFFFSLAMGVNGAFTTGDVFNLYVWFEVMLLSSFVLITMGNKKEQLGGIKYLALNLIGSMLFLAGLGLLYGKTGTLNMAHLAEILKNDQQALLMNSSAALFFVAFG